MAPQLQEHLRLESGTKVVDGVRATDYVTNFRMNIVPTIGAQATKRWASGLEMGKFLASQAQHGDKPLSQLVLGAHCGRGTTIGNYKGKQLFSSADMFRASRGYVDNRTNSLSNSIKRTGPPKCWFCKDATIHTAACFSDDFAADWADKIARKGAVSYGTGHYVWMNGGEFYFTDNPKDPTPVSGIATTWNGIKALEGWNAYGGTQ